MSDRNESDRLQQESTFQRLIRRPEAGSFAVMVVVLVLIAFASNGNAMNALGIKNNLSIISQFGIIATGAALLMIAGEFDLSIGSMIGFAGMSMAMMLKWGLPFGLGEATPFSAFFITLAMTLSLGWLIGTIVVRSGLSSFIVSLGFLFGLRGVTEVTFRLINQSTQISGLQDFKETSFFARLFGGESFGWFYDLAFALGFNLNRRGEQWVTGLDARVVWWMLVVLIAYIILSRTQIGNWIYATGDNKESARANGVPVNRVKVGLFMTTALCATIFAACQVFDTNTADAAKGNLKELEAIAIAVVGGILMTGGFGSVIGVAFGAVTFGLVANAVFYIPWIDGSFYRVFVGAVLLAAVFANERIRKRITGGI
ncbi:monosaccharide ABC transporter membrane protein (CUT2 family) [Litoreibacter meonggei]|uniref:Xylose transport system permease protein XylH n=1 Tax=Litoreibacter meonggei TaxID=1049199 RepID=A0A497X3S2_9RHOB|nr:ABC transporter permease [Litoreibacter meonggei]RLJ59906.1 monosaccharide ABC transporter membrane protein (CUT2 family) [Litoreibacter meonggei]